MLERILLVQSPAKIILIHHHLLQTQDIVLAIGHLAIHLQDIDTCTETVIHIYYSAEGDHML